MKGKPSRPGNAPKLKFGGKISVVPRRFCRLERLWIPKASREGLEALRLQLQQETSRQGEVFFIEPAKSERVSLVNVWLADEAIVAKMMRRGRPWAPETFLQAPSVTPSRIAICTDGFEGQIWQDEQLISSRWWRDAPSVEHWSDFVNGTDISVGLPDVEDYDWYEVPEPQNVRWRSDLSVMDLGRDSLARLVSPVKVAAFAALLLSAPAGMLGGSYVRLTQQNSALEAELSEKSGRLNAIENARRSAFEARRAADAFSVVGDTLAFIDAIKTLKIAVGATPIEIEFAELSNRYLEVRISGADARSIPTLIEALNNSVSWNDVSAATNRAGQVVVKGYVTGLPDETG